MELDLFCNMASAAPEPRRAKNRLIVDNNPNDDNSVLSMHENTMTLLDIFSGDSVLVKGKRKKETVLVCTSDASCEEGKVRVNGGIRKNLGVKLGDVVGIHKVDNIPYGTKVSVLPFADSIEGITGNLSRCGSSLTSLKRTVLSRSATLSLCAATCERSSSKSWP